MTKRKTKQDRNNVQLAAAISRQVSMKKASYRVSKGNTVITHSEFITPISVINSASITVRKFGFNPGVATTFPWLSSFAGNFEKYRIRKLKYHYVPVVGTTVSGRVAMAFAMDALQPTPTSNQQFFSIQHNNECAVWDEMELQVGTDNKEYYVRGSSNVGIADLKTTDMGVLFIATNYSAATATWGEVYVTYEVELITPTANTNVNIASELYGSTGLSPTVFFPQPSTTVIGPSLSTTSTPNQFQINVSGTIYVNLELIGNTLVTMPSLAAVVAGSCTVTSYISGFSNGNNGIAGWRVDVPEGSGPVVLAFTGASATTVTSVFLYGYTSSGPTLV